MRSFGRALVAGLVLLGAAAPGAQSQSAAELFKEALSREVGLRKTMDGLKEGDGPEPTLSKIRALVRDYEEAWRAHPTSGYSDNALWQGATLAADAFWHFGEAADRRTALRLYEVLTSRFRTSSRIREVPAQVERLKKATASAAGAAEAVTAPANTASLTAIRREVLPDALRVTFELDRETPFNDQRPGGAERVFLELRNVRPADAVKDARLSFAEDVVRQIRVGRPEGANVRVALDLLGAGEHSVYTLYNPYRIVMDFERTAATKAAVAIPKTAPGANWKTPSLAPVKEPARTAANEPAVAPRAPSANTAGGYSLSRQLGLGVARIVIDPGHGGHDPGAQVSGITESELVLDIALRLEKLLKKQTDVEVVMTRRANSFVALDERTAIANRAGADLFLSIHANASVNTSVRGIETYFLNFAPNPEAEAVAARENAGSSKTMRNLPDIVRTIALNNKLDESRDLATIVQGSLFDRLRKSDEDTKNLGVKQAPFMVLVGATMPAVLTEIAFITNEEEGQLIKTEKYRQQVAEALLLGIMNYQQTLKKPVAVAGR
jgi:N-acetylmuramoyl-L-alanine amidase